MADIFLLILGPTEKKMIAEELTFNDLRLQEYNFNIISSYINIFLFFFQILLARCTIHSEKCDKICAEVEVDEHTECGCECKVKRHHCNEKQVSAFILTY